MESIPYKHTNAHCTYAQYVHSKQTRELPRSHIDHPNPLTQYTFVRMCCYCRARKAMINLFDTVSPHRTKSMASHIKQQPYGYTINFISNITRPPSSCDTVYCVLRPAFPAYGHHAAFPPPVTLPFGAPKSSSLLKKMGVCWVEHPLIPA